MSDPDPCDACKALVGAGRKVQPHPQLRAVGPRREAAFGGMRADEQDYICETCGKEWMRETGNSGDGWM